MRKYIVTCSVLFCFISTSLSLSGCSKELSGESLVGQSAKDICINQTPEENECIENLDSLDSLSARVALAAEDIIRTFGTKSDQAILFELDTQKVLIQARKSAGDLAPEERPSTKLSALDIPEDVKHSLIKPALNALADVSRGYSSAALEQDLQKIFVELESKLQIILTDFMTQPKPSKPKIESSLGLLEPKTLVEIEDNLKRKRRSLSLYNALLGTGETPLIKMLDERVSQIQAIKTANWYISYHQSEDKPFKEFSEKDWKLAKSQFDEKVELEKKRLGKLIETTTGWPELRADINSIRGPPLEKLLFNNLHSHDIAITEWTRSEARLQALSDELVDNSGTPEEYRNQQDKTKHRVLALLADDSLQRANALVKRALSESDTNSPEQLLYPDKLDFYKAWEKSIKEELKRRENGVAVDYQSNRKMNTLISQYSDIDQPMSNRAQARFVSILEQRFGNNKSNIPIALINDYQNFREQALIRSAEDIADLVNRFQKVNTTLALSTDRVTESNFDQPYRRARDYFIALVSEYEHLSEFAMKQGVSTPFADDKTKKALALFPASRWNGNNPPEPIPPSTPEPPKGPKGGGSGGTSKAPQGNANIAVSAYDLSVLEKPRSPSFEKFLYRVEAYLAIAESQLSITVQRMNDIHIKPIKHSTQKGRRIVLEENLRQEKVNWQKLTVDNESPRLADNLKEWQGRLNKEGKPYQYVAEVANPKTFNALGGGIHFGIAASLTNAIDLRSHSLIYQQGTKYGQLILRDGNTKSELILFDKLNPVSTKALYRFASANRNAAISIGWSSEVFEKDNLQQTDGSSILIDPYLVDTKVGQDLILADSIPWNLADPIFANEQKVSFAAEFKDLSKLRDESRLAPYEQFIRESKALFEKNQHYWTKRLNNELMKTSYSLTALALVSENNFDDARNWYIGQHFMTAYKKAGIEITAIKNWESDLRRSIVKPLVANNQKNNNANQPEFMRDFRVNESMMKHFRTDLLTNDIAVELKLSSSERSYVNSRMKELKKDLEPEKLGQEFDSIAKKNIDNITQARAMLRELVKYKVKKGEAERAAVEYLLADYYARLKAKPDFDQESIDNQLAWILYQIIAPTTLAVLYDEKVELTIDENSANFDSELKYRYATNYVALGEKRIGIGHSDNDPENQVNTIESLTNLVNDNIDELYKLYPPMARIKKYSEMSALFRWANTALKAGQLGAINLADLGQYPANDPSNYPTADLLIRER